MPKRQKLNVERMRRYRARFTPDRSVMTIDNDWIARMSQQEFNDWLDRQFSQFRENMRKKYPKVSGVITSLRSVDLDYNRTTITLEYRKDSN